MILTKKMEDGFIAYDISTRSEGELSSERCVYDDVFVHWEEKTVFGLKRMTKKFVFKRLKVYVTEGYSYNKVDACITFCKRLNSLQNKNGAEGRAIVAKLKEEFSGSDDYSMGVQYALSVLESNKLI